MAHPLKPGRCAGPWSRMLTIAAASLCLATAAAAQAPEQLVTANAPAGLLHGTMAGHAAGETRPVMLIIPGSGPTNRDGNSPLGISANTYRMLAADLAAAGVTTIRIDKRGMFENASPDIDPNAVTIADYVADMAAWVTAARQATGADCIWLAGHSEGGLVALASAQSVPDLCGLVLIAAPGRPLGDVMREQLRANPANAIVLDDALHAIDSLEAGDLVDVSGMHPALQQLFAPVVQTFLISLYSYDPAALLAVYDGPVLIVQGDTDLQVTVADAEHLAAARPGLSPTIIPGMNHVLKPAPGDDRAANFATYGDAELGLAAGMVDATAGFLTTG